MIYVGSTSGHDRNPYGKTRVPRDVGRALGLKKSPIAGAHRVAYLIFRGPFDPDLVIDHRCRVGTRVNPYHLEVVTTRRNALRACYHRNVGEEEPPEEYYEEEVPF